ncbi:glycosyltransferase family 2 protein [Mycena maculata]|uniref:chitin synthase n=1 Tax=Mycena maculata TaxID=230809 RepID=A0AAD7NHR2_9AGAR|nr:glycosyltransferase family 2 protein [Mycena maculata]
MDYRGDRPPRQTRPRQQSQSPAPSPPSYDRPQQQQQYGGQQYGGQQYQQAGYGGQQGYDGRGQYDRPQPTPFLPNDGSRGHPNVSFRNTETGDRSAPISTFSPHSAAANNSTFASAQSAAYQGLGDAEGGGDPDRVLRKKSLVRPDREKIEPGHRQWHYRNQVAHLEEEGPGRVGVMPSTTGNYPQREALRRGRSLLAREEDVHESGLALFKRGATLRRKRSSAAAPLNPTSPTTPATPTKPKLRTSCLGDYAPGPKGPWMLYCYLLTACVPPPMMRACGLRSREQQRAWREKMGLISIVLGLMAVVGFITFGFTQTVCGTPPNRFHGGAIGDANIGLGSVVINGYDYDFSSFDHPAVGTFDGKTNPLFVGGWNLAGNDASFMFQNTNERCLGLLSKPNTSQITGTGEELDWYFPCNIYSQYGTTSPNTTAYGSSTNCHVSAKGQLASMRPQGQVYYTWDDLKNSSRQLVVFESSVLDLELLAWLDPTQVTFPALFTEMASSASTNPWVHRDITAALMRQGLMNEGHCLQDLITVGFIDSNSIGCIASQVLLYLSLIFIIGVVLIRFVMAVMFAWFFSWKIGTFPKESYEERMKRAEEVEAWTSDIYKAAPSGMRPNVTKQGLRKGEKRKTFLPSTSRFTPAEGVSGAGGSKGRPATAYGAPDGSKRGTLYAPSLASGKTAASAPSRPRSLMSWGEQGSLPPARGLFAPNPAPFALAPGVVPQPPADYEPFNFPLAHTICLVTAYSESVEGLRTTLDSLATTDYPNSHKVILIIADGVVKGAGNEQTTPEICLGMMTELIVPRDEVEAHSYVAIADGHKRHNMARVYAGFYAYDDATVERSKQQRVPIILVAKVGNPLEAGDAKPGNRGKRDSQIVLMAFLQKVMFDERMTTFEYEFFNSLWKVGGVSPERYELVLCVDADTKVFPDSVTRMASCMVADAEIMGLCGETKIANKGETFVTMMQVFEYYISHHLTKAFESMFGGVTCLPGCFSMYRIKAPKGTSGFWVPILANPDIVEHYSENVVDTLHKKNLLLLGEDRYLTTLLLKTFPKRKNIFCPQAVCKTVVPDTFRVLISQRRRWINSTIHNLAELVLVRDLCGTFCFSMQFVVGMELTGTLVLPAAITFTLYLIIDSIIPHHANTTIPLVLLAVVLGLPGVLIVITSRKVAYVGWMLIYLLSLPVWNGVLPAYAFWHFDDFSWGQTRKLEGEGKEGGHGDKEGEFDATHIVMKRWAEFERERRWKSGTQSREDEGWNNSNRYSLASNSDPTSGGDGAASTTDSSNYATPGPRQRHDSNTLLMLPTPLAVSRNTTASAVTSSSTTTSMARSSEEGFSDAGVSASTSTNRLIPNPADPWGDDVPAPVPVTARQGYRASIDTPPGSANPFRSAGSSPGIYDEPESEYASPTSMPSRYSAGAGGFAGLGAGGGRGGGGGGGRGVSLMDSGPVPGPDGGVRRVARPSARRPTSQAPVGAGGQGPQQQNRYSRSSTVGYGVGLPPGAAPPLPYAGS